MHGENIMPTKLCLMIECKDKVIFTSKKNYKALIEFANNFNLKLHHARTDEQNIFDLEKIPELFCNASYTGPKEYTIVKSNVLRKKNSRQDILKQASNIREHIKKYIIKHDIVTFSQLQTAFENQNISTTALNNLFRQVRKELEESGLKICKIKNGYYKIN